MKVSFKKSFLKDLKKLPAEPRKKIETLVFEQIPRAKEFKNIKNTKKLKD